MPHRTTTLLSLLILTSCSSRISKVEFSSPITIDQLHGLRFKPISHIVDLQIDVLSGSRQDLEQGTTRPLFQTKTKIRSGKVEFYSRVDYTPDRDPPTVQIGIEVEW